MKEYFEDDRAHYKEFDILSEEEKKKMFAIYGQKEKEFLERIKDMTKEEKNIECEKFDLELERIFEEFKKKSIKKQDKKQKLAIG